MKNFFRTLFKTDLSTIIAMAGLSILLATFFTAITTIVRMSVQYDLPSTALGWMFVPIMCHGFMIYVIVQVFREGGFKSDD